MNHVHRKTLLKPSEASAHFNIPLPTIYFWYRMGNIDGVKVNGTCLRIFRESLQEFLRSRHARDEQSHRERPRGHVEPGHTAPSSP